MSYKRNIMPAVPLDPNSLTAAMTGIGMNFAAKPDLDAYIEDTLYSASLEGMEKDDLRVLAVLVTWLEEHHRWINADRLYRVVSQSGLERVRAFWSAVAQWQSKDRRFLRMTHLYAGPRIDLLRTGTDFLLGRHGEDVRFRGTPLRIPAKVLRGRQSDILSSAALAIRHRIYRYRIMMGPTYRADMWAQLEAAPSISVAELARRTYGSFATASQVKRDWTLLRSAPEALSPSGISDHVAAQ